MAPSKINEGSLFVVKRDGKQVAVKFDKIVQRISKIIKVRKLVDLYGLDTMIAQEILSDITAGITTQEIDQYIAAHCWSHNLKSSSYGRISSEIVISSNHKSTPNTFSEAMNLLANATDFDGKLSPVVDPAFNQMIQEHKDTFNSIIIHERDFSLDYIGFKTLERSYLLRIIDHSKDKKKMIVERFQYLILRVAAFLHGTDFENVKKTYDAISLQHMTHATPTLFNAGTPYNQLLSCFLLGMEDSIQGIYKCLSDVALISKRAGGIGIHIHRIRGNGTYIRGTGGDSTGVIPMMRVFNNTALYVNQGGKRNGSIAMYLAPWHIDIKQFINVRKNNGEEEERTRDLFHALWIPDIFMKKCIDDNPSNRTWYLFDPDECPLLNQTFGEEFEKAYESYVSLKKYRKIIPDVRTLLDDIITSQLETGTPYICFSDHANRKSNQKNVGIIQSSNLCTEIMEYSDHQEYACCTLASIVLGNLVKPDKTFDFDRLRDIVQIATRNLNIIIDKNDYPVIETKRSNMRHRPIGIGVQGLADCFAKMEIPYGSDESRTLNKQIFKHIYYFALLESVELAKLHGPYETFPGSPASQGILQPDMWDIDIDNDHEFGFDWVALKQSIKQHGLRNSLLVAPMPTASTSKIMGQTESFEPFFSLVNNYSTLAGDFTYVNPHLQQILEQKKLWTSDIRDKIIINRGSVQNISEIPSSIRDLFRISWEIKNKVMIDMSAERGPFVCQSQSFNRFINMKGENSVSNARSTAIKSLIYSWKLGLKTACYYTRCNRTSDPADLHMDPERRKQLSSSDQNMDLEEPKICEECSA